MGGELPDQAEDESGEEAGAERSPSPDAGETPGIQGQPGGAQTWVNTDFYAQVSNVMPSGGVVLSPGQQLRIQESTKAETHQKAKDPQEEEKKEGERRSQLLLMDPQGSGYTMESSAHRFNTPPRTPEPQTEAAAELHQSPYILPDSPQTQIFAPVADYTVVQELDSQHSFLLNPPPRQSPPPSTPQNPLKAPPAMPVGYVTPDLLGNLSP